MIKLADTLAPMADFPAVEAKDVAFSDNKTLQEKYNNGELGGAGTSVTVDTEMSDASENTVQNKVIKKYVDNNLTDVQTELTNIKKELSDGMTLVADAITEKGVETATDATLEVMATNIRAIEVGVDTSDADATSSDIMSGKTAYVNGVKITGTASSSEIHGATVNVSSSNSELVGTTVTISKDGVVKGTKTLDSSLSCSFTGIQEIGEYVVSITDGNITSEESISITGDNIVNKDVISVVFNALSYLKSWLDAGRVTQSFSTLDEVLASEITVRQLMTIHASVDMLKKWMIADPSIVDTFVANATAMKWMGLRDYAYDTLTAGVDGLEEKILASDNWEYALKDHVPVMTSNTAPYGEVSAISQLNAQWATYKAFNYDDSSSFWHSAVVNSPDWFWIGYNFINPIRVNRLKFRVAGGRPIAQIEVQGSFDGDNWDSIYSNTDVYGSTDANVIKEYNINFSNDKYYTRYRLRGYVDHLQSGAYAMAIYELQFYGRSEVDYSEREFAEGSTMKYIYDHGIIFNDFIGGLNYVKYSNPSESFLEGTYARVGKNTILQTNNMVDLSKYSMLYIKSVLYNPTATNSYINVHLVWNVKVTSWYQTSNSSILEGYLLASAQDECGPTVRSLDISSITKMCTLAMQCGQSSTTEFTEWWLE